MTALEDLVPALKRHVAVPGEFDTYYPNTSDEDLTASLGDGFASAQLDGFFQSHTLNPNVFSVTPNLSIPEQQLTIVYTSVTILYSTIRNMRTMERYEAGPTSYEIQRAASVLDRQLQLLQAKLDDIKGQAKAGAYATVLRDGYLDRMDASAYLSLPIHM